MHQIHRTIRAALNEAMRRKRITENPALLARAPKVEEEEVEPYSVTQVKSILEAAQQKRKSVRWAIALALGCVKVKRSACSGPISISKNAR